MGTFGSTKPGWLLYQEILSTWCQGLTAMWALSAECWSEEMLFSACAVTPWPRQRIGGRVYLGRTGPRGWVSITIREESIPASTRVLGMAGRVPEWSHMELEVTKGFDYTVSNGGCSVLYCFSQNINSSYWLHEHIKKWMVKLFFFTLKY